MWRLPTGQTANLTFYGSAIVEEAEGLDTRTSKDRQGQARTDRMPQKSTPWISISIQPCAQMARLSASWLMRKCNDSCNLMQFYSFYIACSPNSGGESITSGYPCIAETLKFSAATTFGAHLRTKVKIYHAVVLPVSIWLWGDAPARSLAR